MAAATSRFLRVMILLYEEPDRSNGKLVEMLHKLHEMGHHASFAAKTLSDLGMDTKRIIHFIKATEADACMEEIQSHGIPVGAYNLPDWNYDLQGLHQCMDSLFQSTPPTALIVDQSALMFSIMQFLATRRLRVPEDVSVVCLEDHPSFHWTIPMVTHLYVDRSQWVKRIAQWVGRVAAGKEDHKLTLTNATIIDGGTMGPAPLQKRITETQRPQALPLSRHETSYR